MTNPSSTKVGTVCCGFNWNKPNLICIKRLWILKFAICNRIFSDVCEMNSSNQCNF